MLRRYEKAASLESKAAKHQQTIMKQLAAKVVILVG